MSNIFLFFWTNSIFTGEKYIKKKTLALGKNAIPQERFLIQQMRMLNDEIKSRITNASELRQNYFDNLKSKLREIREIKSRISSTGANSLRSFTSDLEMRIEETLESGKINYKRQKIWGFLNFLLNETLKAMKCSRISLSHREARLYATSPQGRNQISCLPT